MWLSISIPLISEYFYSFAYFIYCFVLFFHIFFSRYIDFLRSAYQSYCLHEHGTFILESEVILMNTFTNTMKKRRSRYALGKDMPIEDSAVIKIIEEVVLHTPTGFNMQSNKALLLLNKHHDQFWEIVMETLRTIVPAASFSATEQKINAFKGAHGTVLFFDDTAITDAFAKANPLYKESFPIYALQSNGMMQFALWNALAEQGIGASLQHYNPLVDEAVHTTWKVPAEWKLIAQMPFGSILGEDGEKQFNDLVERIHVFQ